MDKNSLKIAGKTYPIKFGMSVFKTLGKKWGKNSLQEVLKEFQSLSSKGKEGEDISFDSIDKIADLVCVGISRSGIAEDDLPDRDDVIDSILFPEKLTKVMNLLSDSLPHADEERSNGKKKASPKKK